MGVYIPPSIRTVREDLQSSVVLTGGAVVSALIGTALGKQQQINGLLQQLGATDVHVVSGLGVEGPISTLVQIRAKLSGGISYKVTDDFSFTVGTQTIDWSVGSLLARPFALPIVEQTGASSLVDATTYYYVVTALKDTDEVGPITGETAASNEVAFLTTSATSQLIITWTTITGAKSYNIYRTTIQGDYTGATLLTTVVGEFANSYTDTGTSTSTGSPPGLATNGRATATGVAPYDLVSADTLTVTIDGGAPQVVTFDAARATRPGSGATYAALTGLTLILNIDNGTAQTITFTAAAVDAATTAAEINAAPLIGGFAAVNATEVDLSSDTLGTGSEVDITGGTALAAIGHTVGTTNGTGDVANIDAVTAAEVNTVMAADLTGENVGVTAGFPFVETVTSGATGDIIVAAGSANLVILFPTTLQSGSDPSAATALRRPALNGGDFYIDYIFIFTSHFTATRFTNLGLLISEYGLGSDLAVGGTLCMGRAGRGNSASIVVAMSVPDDTLFSYQTALGFLAPRKDIDLVVPLTVVSGIDAALKSHCEDQSTVDKRRECLGILGTAIDTQVGDATTSGTAIFKARALNTRRVSICHPWPVVDIQDSTGSIVETELDGWATAAAVAGRIQSLPDRAEPATQKQLFGIKRLGITLDEIEENLCGGAGVCVVTDELGQILIKDGVTTDVANEADAQISINLTDDHLRKSLRIAFRDFRGRKLLPNLLSQVESLANRLLASFVKFALIAGYDPDTISAVQNATTLTQVDVNFTYQPVFPARIIEFRYSLDLTPVSLAA